MKLLVTIGLEILAFLLLAYLYYIYQKRKIIRTAKEDLCFQAHEFYKSINRAYPLDKDSSFEKIDLERLKQDLFTIECENNENQQLKDTLIIDIEGLIKVL